MMGWPSTQARTQPMGEARRVELEGTERDEELGVSSEVGPDGAWGVLGLRGQGLGARCQEPSRRCWELWV